MVAERLKPIFSSRASDGSNSAAVDAFVVGLAEQIDMLQDAEAEGDLVEISDLATALVETADAAGFEALAAVAGTLAGVCAEQDVSRVRERLLELTEIAQRVRLGYKGAL